MNEVIKNAEGNETSCMKQFMRKMIVDINKSETKTILNWIYSIKKMIKKVKELNTFEWYQKILQELRK